MSRRKPKFMREEYEVNLVSTPPPGPPEYELVNAWPHAPRNARRSKAPIIISLIALIIAILSIYSSMTNLFLLKSSLGTTVTTLATTTSTHIVTSPLISTTTTTATTRTTITTSITQISTAQITSVITSTFLTTVVEQKKIYAGDISFWILPESSGECAELQQMIRMVNINFNYSNYNETHRLLQFSEIIMPSSQRINEENFTVEGVYGFDINLTELRAQNGNKIYNMSICYKPKPDESKIIIYFKTEEEKQQKCSIIELGFKD